MKSILSFCAILCAVQLFAQNSNDINQSIISEVIFDDQNNMTLSWIPKSSADSYSISYRTAFNDFWKTAATDVTDTFYVFSEPVNDRTEIRIETETGNLATSYMYVGNNYFTADQTEKMLLIVTDSIFNALETLIEDYRAVLGRQFIETELVTVSKIEGVQDVKTKILNSHNVEALDYIFLLGNVPVPYSGNAAIDGHTNDHEGAWVADTYYGELDGTWTDSFVDNESASRDANKNIPGDGKFDNTSIPSNVEIPVGRVDFSRLPKLEQTEIELTERYLLRNIGYRKGEWKGVKRAIIDNNFNLAEGFAQGALKSFHTFLEPDSINYNQFTQCLDQNYLFTFGAGGGSYQSASGIINTDNLVTDSIQSVFMTIFGSYHGDWDIENNLMRAALARGSALTNAWSGRPVWYFHPMAMGETIGRVTLNTQNFSGLTYVSQFGNRWAHTSLLGDPSLKMYYHPEISTPVINSEQVTWEYLANDEEVMAYTVYYQQGDEWILIGDGPREESSIGFAEIPAVDDVRLMIRPVGYIQSRSGSYYNEGIGTSVDVFLVNNEEIDQSIRIFPNPAQDYISISSEKKIGEVVILDMAGRVVKNTNGQSHINISDLTNGAYLLMLDNKQVRFVKQ